MVSGFRKFLETAQSPYRARAHTERVFIVSGNFQKPETKVFPSWGGKDAGRSAVGDMSNNHQEKTASSLPNWNLRQAAFDQRVEKMRKRAAASRNLVAAVEKWFENEVPARVAESDEGIKLASTFAPAMAALQAVENLTQAPYTSEWIR
jgi:hypothetical protein